MTFNKCTINGKSYGDPVDDYGNPMDITSVSALFMYSVCSHILFLATNCEQHIVFCLSFSSFFCTITRLCNCCIYIHSHIVNTAHIVHISW